jgi:Probable cobalt transporter subunit (CbtB)
MERNIATAWGIDISEPILFLAKSFVFLSSCAVVLYVALAAGYPAVHDTLHNFRHALAIVPCH